MVGDISKWDYQRQQSLATDDGKNMEEIKLKSTCEIWEGKVKVTGREFEKDIYCQLCWIRKSSYFKIYDKID